MRLFGAGELWDGGDLTSTTYTLLATLERRGLVGQLQEPQAPYVGAKVYTRWYVVTGPKVPGGERHWAGIQRVFLPHGNTGRVACAQCGKRGPR